MTDRNCDKCVYGRRSGNCTAWNCKGTVTVEDIKAEARQSAIDEFAKLIHEDLYQLNHHQVDFLAEQLKEQKNG